MNKYCAIIPVYNHPRYLVKLTEYLISNDLAVIMIDDGSGVETATIIDELALNYQNQFTMIRHPLNQGKGFSVQSGLKLAQELGFSHALQLDSDGQHNWEDINQFLVAAEKNPDKIIIGSPIYDMTVNKKRFYARYLTHVWIWINTLSFEIKDSMCGFRIYPIAAVCQLLTKVSLGNRMDFDPEILVRLKWEGYHFVNIATKVKYPAENISNFKLIIDNILISKMHAKLFFLMLLRSPKILVTRILG